MEYKEDTGHPENVGLYMLQVIKAEDQDTQFDGGQDILYAGIYRPEEDIQEEKEGSIDYIVNDIMESEIAGYVGKSEAEIEAVYGPKQNEGAWYNGLLYTQHKNFSGDFGYGNADPDAVTESIESDSICNVIVFKLSEIMPISDLIINKDELEFIYDDSEGDYFYILKYIDAPIRIDCDESGNIGQDPLIFIYLRT